MMPRGAPRAHVCEKRSRSHARTSLGPMENARQCEKKNSVVHKSITYAILIWRPGSSCSSRHSVGRLLFYCWEIYSVMTDNVEHRRGRAPAHEKFPYLAHSRHGARGLCPLAVCVSVFICARVRAHWLALQPANSLFSEIWGCVLAAARLGQRWKGKRGLIRFCSCRKTGKFCCTITFLPSANLAGSFFELGLFVCREKERESSLQSLLMSTKITIIMFYFFLTVQNKCIFPVEIF
jgi:hypothetical protein